VSSKNVHGPFFFTEASITGDSFLGMLENWLLPQLNTNYDDYILEMDSAPSCPLATPFAGSNIVRFLSLGVC